MESRSCLFLGVAVLTGVFAAVRVEAGSVMIPARSFARGNVRVDAGPAEFADAGPVVVSGPAEHWGWTVEYDVDIPVEAEYTIQICYASAESRPVNVRVDSKLVGRACDRVTFGPMSSGDSTPIRRSRRIGSSLCAGWTSIESRPRSVRPFCPRVPSTWQRCGWQSRRRSRRTVRGIPWGPAT